MNGYQSIQHIANNINCLLNKIIESQSEQQRKHKQVKEYDSALFNVAFEHNFTTYYT